MNENNTDYNNPSVFNLNKSNNYFTSTHPNKYKLHLRGYIPNNKNKIKANIIFLHGYNNHCNRREMIENMGHTFNESGIAFFCFDQYGHGYSDGKRCFIDNYEYFINDIKLLIQILYQNNLLNNEIINENKEEKKEENELYHFEFPFDEYKNDISNAPLFLIGESMGGGLALHAALRKNQGDEIFNYITGLILMAPAIKGKLPPAPVIWILNNVLAKFWPKSSFKENKKKPEVDPKTIWNTEEKMQIGLADRWDNDNDNAVGYGLPMRFGSAKQLIKMMKSHQLSQINLPFVIFHDENDEIVPYEGAKQLMKESPSTNKRIIHTNGSLHEILFNDHQIVLPDIINWVNEIIGNDNDINVDHDDVIVNNNNDDDDNDDNIIESKEYN